MDARTRFRETLLFGRPDKVPFEPGWPRESTLAGWHQQGLPAGTSWCDALLDEVGIPREPPQEQIGLGVSFRMIPEFEEKVLEHRDGHYIVQDWMGAITEISDRYDYTYLRSAKDFVTRKWHRFPVENRADWDAIKWRYDPAAPGRHPTDLDDRCRRLQDRNYLVGLHFNGPFWQMREWCGFEHLCILMVDRPEFVAEMAALWTEFVAGVLERILPHVSPDVIHISEDMAYKAHAMISPAMTREFCKPSYVRWGSQAEAAGVPLLAMDSDGYVGELIPIWIESGISACDPVEVAAHNDICEYRRLFGRKMAYRGGVDKRAMAKGGRTIRDELRRIEPVVRGGGYIPGCDHGVPSDVSWPSFVDYSRLLAKMTGCL